jgi:hypothetical protein
MMASLNLVWEEQLDERFGDGKINEVEKSAGEALDSQL